MLRQQRGRALVDAFDRASRDDRSEPAVATGSSGESEGSIQPSQAQHAVCSAAAMMAVGYTTRLGLWLRLWL